MSKIIYENCDCMVGMARYPDRYFDLAIVDPPYTDTFDITAIGEAAEVKRYNLNSLNRNAPDKTYFEELIRVSKNRIIWGVNYYPYYLGAGRIVWDKNNTGVYSDCELAYHSFSNVTRKFLFTWNGMIQGNMKNKEHRIHPTQKPVALYKWLLTNYAKEGDLILDTHVGSASSLIACHDMGFDAVGFELDPDYYKASLERLQNVQKQITITDWLGESI